MALQTYKLTFFQQKLQIYSNKYWYRNIVIFKADRLDLSANTLINNVVYCTRCSVPISKAHVPLSNSAIKAHEPQVHRNMDMIRMRISSARDLLKSVQAGSCFSRPTLARAASPWENISSFEPSSETVAPRYSKLATTPNLCLFTLITILYLAQILSRLQLLGF